MRRFALILCLVLVPLALFAFDPEELNTVVFTNDTGFDIEYIFFSPGDSNYWGSDILGAHDILEDGESSGFLIHYPDECNEFDFLAIDEDGDGYIIWGVPICDGTPAEVVITLDYLDFDIDTSFDVVQVNIVSAIDYEIYGTFVTPEDSNMFGIDMLGDSTLLNGEVLSLAVPAWDEPSRYYVIAVDEDLDIYSFGIELSNAQAEWSWSIEMSDMN